MRIKLLALGLMSLWMVSCTRPVGSGGETGCRYARFFDIGDSVVVSVSPFDGHADSLDVLAPFDNIVCMSTSYVACLHEVGADSTVTGASGVRFVTDVLVRERAAEVGYEGAIDYERIIGLKPDVVLAYSVSGAVPQYVERLRELGVRVVLLYEHLEEHPLARAEYIRFFGAMVGRMELADSVFDAIEGRYSELAARVAGVGRRKVLMNMPYGDQWYVPGGASYMSRIVEDAGGEILGAVPEKTASSIISVEKAFELSAEADVWLHPGNCVTREQIKSAHPLFADFPVMGRSIYNNTLRSTPGGGNDFWESGAVRPDLVLEDLVTVLHPEVSSGADLHYYIEVK